MKNYLILLLTVTSLIIVSCSGEEKIKEGAYYNNIDQTVGWIQSPSIIKGEAYSGQYFCKVDSVIPYSFGFEYAMEKLSVAPKKIKASVFGKMPDLKNDVILVVHIVADGQNIAWDGISFNKIIKNTSEWAKIELELPVPETMPPTSVLKVYVWSANKGVGYCDDFEIEFIN